MSTNLTSFLGNTIGVKDTGFQEISSNGSRDNAVKLICFPCKPPLLIGPLQPRSQCL